MFHLRAFIFAFAFTLCEASGANAQPAFDTHCDSFSSAAAPSLSCTITTTGAPDVITVLASSASGSFPISVTDTNNLTWHKRAAVNSLVAEWYAVASAPLTNEVITVNISGSGAANIGMHVVAFTGTSSATVFPFDINGTLVANASSATISGINTSNTHDCVVAFYATTFPTTGPTAGAGWTQLYSANFQLVEYQCFTTAQSGLSATLTTGVSAGGAIADAFINAFAAPTIWTKGNVPTGVAIGMNLANVGFFSAELPFLNRIAMSGNWFTANSGGTDVGQEGCLPLDSNGYVTSLDTTNGNPGCGTINYDRVGFGIMQNVPSPFYPAGVYHFLWDGTGTVLLFGDVPSTTCPGTGLGNSCTVTATPSFTGIGINITAISDADHPRNFRLVPDAYLSLYSLGEIIYPPFEQTNAFACMLRFMDWGNTNSDLTIRLWTDYPPITNVTWGQTSQTAGFSAPTSAGTSVGSAVLNFSPTPSFVKPGASVSDKTSGGIIPVNTIVQSITGTTVTLNAVVTGAGVGSGDVIQFSVPKQPVPIPVEVTLANEAGADMWINIPAAATINPSDGTGCTVSTCLVSNVAAYTLAHLNPQNQVVVALSNELWNSPATFVRQYYTAQANALWGGNITASITGTVMTVTDVSGFGGALAPGEALSGSFGSTTISSFGTGQGRTGTYNLGGSFSAVSGTVAVTITDWNSYYAYKLEQVCQEFKTVWGTQAFRVVCAVETQVGNTSVSTNTLTCASYAFNPCDHNQGFDVLSDATYFGYFVPDGWDTLDSGACGAQCLSNVFQEITVGGAMNGVQTGTVTTGNTSVTGLTTSSLIGNNELTVTGICIPASTKVVSVDSSSAITISNAASAGCSGGSSVSLTFTGPAGGMIAQALPGIEADVALAAANHLGLMFYEGGQSLGASPDSVQNDISFVANRFTGTTPFGNMATAYEQYYASLFAIGVFAGNHYNDIQAYTANGAWGFTENIPNAATYPKTIGLNAVAAANRVNRKGYPCSAPKVSSGGSGSGLPLSIGGSNGIN